MLFGKKSAPPKEWDRDDLTPALRCSICTGEQTAGFRSKTTGKFKEVMLIRCDKDLEAFRRDYGITGEIERIY